MAEKIEDLKRDIAELEELAKQATRPRIKDFLAIEIRKLSSELISLQEQLNKQITPKNTANAASMPGQSKRYQVKLNNYAWDQSTKFVKFYITLPKVHTIPQENITCTFTDRTLELHINDLDNKDYVFVINNLLNQIVPESSNWKVKTDMVVINAAKAKETNWACVTQIEKKVKDAETDKFKPDGNMDPNESLMSLMRSMYEKGDDQLKQTIAKAWTESQQNKSNMF